MTGFDAEEEVSFATQWWADMSTLLKQEKVTGTQIGIMIQYEVNRRSDSFTDSVPYPFDAVQRVDEQARERLVDKSLLDELDVLMDDLMRLQRLQKKRDRRREELFWKSPTGFVVSLGRLALFWFVVALLYCIKNPNACTLWGVCAFVGGMTFFCKFTWEITPERL